MSKQEIYVYEVKVVDADGDHTYLYAAISLFDAINSALQLHNDSCDTNLNTDCVTSARRVFDDILFFSKDAQQWFADMYGDES